MAGFYVKPNDCSGVIQGRVNGPIVKEGREERWMRNHILDHKRNIVHKKILVVLLLALFTMMSSTTVAYAQQDVSSPLSAHLQQTPPPGSPTPSKHHKHHKHTSSTAFFQQTPLPGSPTPSKHHKSSGSVATPPPGSPTPSKHHKPYEGVALSGSPTPSEHHKHTSLMTDLQQTPSGSAKMTWNPRSQELTVTLQLSGLQPGSSHAAHIHAGACSAVGKILHPFQDIVADKAGNATSTTTIYNLAGGVPPTGWNITVHQGATAETGTLLCGDVVNTHRIPSVSVPLHPAPAPGTKT